MTEKRFTYFKSKIGFGKQGIDDNLKGYTFDFTMDNVLDCMNNLSEENEQLKQRITTQSVDREQLCKRIDEVRKENEQLKQKIKSINEILSEDIGYIESLRKIEEALK